jgi:hypothetical protein
MAGLAKRKKEFRRAIVKFHRSRLLADDTVKFVFDHVRNVSLSGLVGWAALLLILNPHDNLEIVAGMLLMFGCIFLLILNLANGVRKIAGSNLSRWVKIILSVLTMALATSLFTLLMREHLSRYIQQLMSREKFF